MSSKKSLVLRWLFGPRDQQAGGSPFSCEASHSGEDEVRDRFERLRAEGETALERGEIEAAVAAYREAAALRPEDASVAHVAGSLLGRTGRLDEAQPLLETALAIDPGRVSVYLDLALLHRTRGRPDLAVEFVESARRRAPEEPAVHRALAHLRAELGERERARVHLERLIARGEAAPEDLMLCGNLSAQEGRMEAALGYYDRALEGDPALAGVHHVRASVLDQLGRASEAMEAELRAVALDPNLADAHHGLGLLAYREGDFEGALGHFERALTIFPEFLAAERHRALVLASAGKGDAAIVALQAMLQADPELTEVRVDIGNLLLGQGRFAEAAVHYREALAAHGGQEGDEESDLDPARVNLGRALAETGSLEEAAGVLEEVAGRADAPVEALVNVGALYQLQARLTEAEAVLAQALERQPGRLETLSNALALTNYGGAVEPAESLARHRAWEAAYRNSQAVTPFERYPGSRDPGRRVRVGYLSADFRIHSVGFFMTGLVEGHDRKCFEVIGISNVASPDRMTARFRSAFDEWLDVSAMDDAECAGAIHAAQVDLLVDLGGHTRGGRPGVLVRAPAPVQLTYLGYPNTTGLSTVAYRIGDEIADPPGPADAGYCEQILRIEGGFLSYEAPPELPQIEKDEGAPLVLGSFNELLKIAPRTLALWSELLRSIPDSRLLLKAGAFSDPATRRRVKKRFERHGVESSRLDLLGRTPDLRSHLALYNRMHIALDTFPYNGTTTTFEALAMGTPVVSLSGAVHASRVGEAILSRLGHPEWVAHDEEAYSRVVLGLARDRSALADLSGGLRKTLETSSLCAPGRLSREIEQCYRRAWKEWCRPR